MIAPSSGPAMGLLSSSRMPDEYRVPLHPAHLVRIDPALRSRMVVEQGYAERFRMPDEVVATLVGAVVPRDQVIARSYIVVLAKPQLSDLAELRDGQTLWGWPHSVQDAEVTQLAIDKKLTLIAFEAMRHRVPDDARDQHVFHLNNEIAGYASVFHALETAGLTGHYGQSLTAVVIGFGSTARGAVTALLAHGFHGVRVLTHRSTASIGDAMPDTELVQLVDGPQPYQGMVLAPGGQVPLTEYLAQSDIVVNCTLQDPNSPEQFLRTSDLTAFRAGSLIIDVSCDEHMGFEWARATTFAEPTFAASDRVSYYGVDHSPSYLWNSASWEISAALLPYLPIVMGGPAAWLRNETIARAIDIRRGVVVNPAILTFQNRARQFPHAVLSGKDPAALGGDEGPHTDRTEVDGRVEERDILTAVEQAQRRHHGPVVVVGGNRQAGSR